MNTVACTLFDGSYHFGVGALANSLFAHGYRGIFWVGYRGKLPIWAETAIKHAGWSEYCVCDSFSLGFIRLDTDWHFTNYKPQFMQSLLNTHCCEAHGVVYFDPDIVIKCRWSFYEQWTSYGAGIVQEVIQNVMPSDSPNRRAWAPLINDLNLKVIRNIDSCFNGGFCAVSRDNIKFIILWEKIINGIFKMYRLNPSIFLPGNGIAPFNGVDQDALNIAAMCYEGELSTMGPEAMDFWPAGMVMSHATGSSKPWNKKFIWMSLKGYPPTRAERGYWQHVHAPISLQSKINIRLKLLSIQIAAFIGRFYSRN